MQERQGGKRLIKKEYFRRGFSLLLCLCMALSLFCGVVAFPANAAQKADSGFCKHHPEHTEECGYKEEVEGQPCAHEHDESCGYAAPTEEQPCFHVHDEICGYVEHRAEIPCDLNCVDQDGDGVIDHETDCFYTPAVEGAPCAHEHDGGCGYVAPVEGKPCFHAHNEDCGYAETVEAHPCEYVCKTCRYSPSTEFPAEETQEEIKARLLYQIMYEDWDPYGEDMTLAEFYALMELFQEGMLPLEDTATVGSPATGPSYAAPGFDEPGAEEPDSEEPKASDVYIPRTMFLFSGLSAAGITGDNAPLPYPPETDDPAGDIGAYPPGLDQYGVGYMRPPESWKGVEVNDELKAVVIMPKPNENDDDPTVAGDVDQSLFQSYGGYYVRRVTAEGIETAILGVVDKGSGEYVYYYMSAADQDTAVSSTTLPEGQKFIVQYVPLEHEIKYKVEMANGGDLPNGAIAPSPENNFKGNDAYKALLNSIFGADRLDGTVDGQFNFNVTGPYYYTTEIYLETDGVRATDPLTGVGTSWPLGAEPVYKLYGVTKRADTGAGPASMVYSDIFHLETVSDTSTIVAVLTPKSTPQFVVKDILDPANANNRGTSAAVDYDFDKDYATNVLKVDQTDPRYDAKYTENRAGGYPNLSLRDDSGGWNWNSSSYHTQSKDMWHDSATDTYSYSWTFQTNGGNYKLDILQINETPVLIPMCPMDIYGGVNDEIRGTESGTAAWYMETTLPDGAVIQVEFLLAWTGNKTQRIYRISVTGARSDITITSLNLMMFSGGGDEIAPQNLVGVHADSGTQTGQEPAIEYYNKDNIWVRNAKGNVIIDEINYENGDKKTGGDDASQVDHFGANVRFKLADGYASPYYFLENSSGEVISDQASATRAEDGSVASQNEVLPLTYDGSTPYLKYDDMEGTIVPVTSSGQLLYNKDGNQVTDWKAIKTRTETIDNGDGTTTKVTKLDPELYANPDGTGEPLAVDQVIPQKDTPVDVANVLKADGTLSSQYIYGPDEDGWYYIRLTGQGGSKFAVLTIIARPVKYVIRYMLGEIPAYTPPDKDTIPVHEPTDMPAFEHYQNRCHKSFFWDTDNGVPGEQYDDNNGYYYDVAINTSANISNARPTDPSGYHTFVDWVLVGADEQPVQRKVYDADGSPVYKTDEQGNIVYETDAEGQPVLGEDGKPIPIQLTEEIHFPFGGTIDINSINEYAILNGELGGNDTDVDVLRLMPTWKPLINPFKYSVVLDWVDAQGELHQEHFKDFWADILTESPGENNVLTVFVNKNAGPLLDWIAQHPTYTFWDAVNNAVDNPTTAEKEDEKAIQEALDNDIPALSQIEDRTQYEKVLAALLNRDISGDVDQDGKPIPNNVDDFTRLGNYSFLVNEDNGTIIIWMCEDKGGLVFHKDVEQEPFIVDDEFYFTVTHVEVGENGELLNNTYKAYPEQAYDENGNPRDIRDSDAWVVTFVNGEITKIVKKDETGNLVDLGTYFSVKNGEGIMLYVPAGKYTITELGSKSGGSYQVDVTYKGRNGETQPGKDWVIPSGDLWLRGSETKYILPTIPNEDFNPELPEDPITNPKTKDNPDYPKDGVSQVSATVNFETGEHNVVQTLTFHNKTSSLVIEKEVRGVEESEILTEEQKKAAYTTPFTFTAELILPVGVMPVEADEDKDGKPDYYYFVYNRYDMVYAEDELPGKNEDGELYGTKTNGQTGRAVLVLDEEWNPEENGYPEDYTHWTITGLLARPDPEEDGSYDWSKVELAAAVSITLTHRQRIAIVITAPEDKTSGDEIHYIVKELGASDSGLRPNGQNPESGSTVPGEAGYALFINVPDGWLTAPATGGLDTTWLYLWGTVFIASGLGLVCLNLKPARRRGRRER